MAPLPIAGCFLIFIHYSHTLIPAFSPEDVPGAP